MSDWKTRLQEEHMELFTKMAKLASFLKELPEGLSKEHERLLRVQLSAMDTYLCVLGHRMDLAEIKMTKPQ